MTMSEHDLERALAQWGRNGRSEQMHGDRDEDLIADLVARKAHSRSGPMILALAMVIVVIAVGAVFLSGPADNRSRPAGPGPAQSTNPSASPSSSPRGSCITITVTAASTQIALPASGLAEQTLRSPVPAHVHAVVTGSCRQQISAVAGYLYAGHKQVLAASPRDWTITKPGSYALRFVVPMCAGQTADCLGGLAELGSIRIDVQ